MTKFKSGDKVRCVNAGYLGISPPLLQLKEGAIYTVKRLCSFEQLELEELPDLRPLAERFELVDTITVTMELTDAIEHLLDFPNSKYLAPAVERATGEFPYSPKSEEDFLRFDRPGTVVTAAGEPTFLPWMRLEERWIRYDYGDSGLRGDLVDVFHETGEWSNLVVLYSPAQGEISFEIPVDEARKIGGCTIPALVAEYDKKHNPKSPMLVWLEEMAPGTAFRKRYGNLFVKVGENIHMYSSADGRKTETLTLEEFAQIYKDPTIYTCL